ncbi:MAG: response regulator transcription factor [Pirellulaceae bacterium]|nr:response regulator transcription factor [Pirellulaceae bacterium]
MRTPTARSQAQLADDHTREIPKVLCIDDDPDFVNALQLRLNRFEVEVIQAFFGTQGVWLATREKPDLVITDVRMPQGGGEYVIETLGRHSETADIPIIVLTAERDCRALRRLRDLGAESCLTKPFRFAELVPRLSQYIELEQRL